MSPRFVAALLSASTFLVAGCSPEDGGSATTEPLAPAATDTTALDSAATTTSVGLTDSTEPESPVALSEVAELGVVNLDEVEPGPHPVLGWEPLEGASSYWLVVVDAAGEPYWAWTGGDSRVRVGGGSAAEVNQTAVVHEVMSWRIAAFDANGTLIALSPAGSISP